MAFSNFGMLRYAEHSFGTSGDFGVEGDFYRFFSFLQRSEHKPGFAIQVPVNSGSEDLRFSFAVSHGWIVG